MRSILIFIFSLLFPTVLLAQGPSPSGMIAGKLTDREMNGEPLPFANVIIKGSSSGATTDLNGLFKIEDVKPGVYTLTISFIGYESREINNVEVAAGKVTEINTELGASAAALDEVVITTVSRKDSKIALLLEQKSAVNIKESIGAQELAKMGVSDVAKATTRISGVSGSEASGDIFVRGLGDRYLYTTMNNLPIPSDDVERKNIDLGLFSTGVIQDVGISKTWSSFNSADQASGTIDISSRALSGASELELGIKAGINTNVLDRYENFKLSANRSDVTLGFYNRDIPLQDALNNQGWDPVKDEMPLNRSYSFTAGKGFGDRLRLLFTGSQSTSYEYNKGLFREYGSNNLYDYFTDAEEFSRTDNTTGLLDASLNLNSDHQVRYVGLFVNKLTDEVYESGRNAKGVVFEETNTAEDLNQFIRDQNITQTRLFVHQFHGQHKINSNNHLEWAMGYNTVDAGEPNRIRNELNLDGEGFIQLGRTGGFQQRKSTQQIEDAEFNGLIRDKITFSDPETARFLEVGGNFRNKQRDFYSRFFGVTETSLNSVNPPSPDDLSSIFTTANFENGILRINRLNPEIYEAELQSYSGFATLNYDIGKWNFNLGARYQRDELDVAWAVNNYPSTLPQYVNKKYNNLYPAVNIKYSPSERSNLRFAGSRTITLPEFKEVAPFEYVSQTGQVTRGNPALEASKNLNLDLKYEFFPSNGQLVSLAGFYKNIKDPINKVLDRGAAGRLSYFNAGDEANVYGIELETRLNLIDNEDPADIDLDLSLNATRMWHSQTLKDVYNENGSFVRTFRYNNKEEVGLQGASDWIFNGSLSLSTASESPWNITLVGNYASDKIYALGAPEIQTQPDVFYNDEIIEKGFVTLDAVISKGLGDHWSFKLSGENLLNPEIERIQAIRPSSTGIEKVQSIRSYTTGAVLSLGIGYSF
ncbi:MAG: TonB-dependent receptor [Salinimicrobium sediminis]|nr:TonB-dependent receptor [Salinimicrobium sediminis]